MEQTLTRDGIRRGETAKLAASIDEATSDRVKVAERELGDETDRRIARLKEEQDRLQRALDHAKKRVGVEGADIRRVVEIALKDDGAALRPAISACPRPSCSIPTRRASPRTRAGPRCSTNCGRAGRPTAKDRARWRRETPVRGLVFEPPKVAEGEPEPQDVVQLHLEHRLIKRLISRFVSQGFRATVGRITAVVGPNSSPRVVLIGRLSLFGPAARRLHEEIIPITAAWRDIRRDESPLTPFAEAGEATTIRQLDEALRDGASPGRGVLDRLAQTVERDIADLRPYLEARAAESEATAKAELAENGRREAEAMAALLQRQIDKVREAMRSKQPPPAPTQLDLFGPSHEEIQETGGAGAAPVRGGPAVVGRQAAASPERAGKRAREGAPRLRSSGAQAGAYRPRLSLARDELRHAHDLSRASGRNRGMAELSPARGAGGRRERAAREGAVAHPPDAARHRGSREGASPRPGGGPGGRSASGASRRLDVLRTACWAGRPSSSPAAPGGLRSIRTLTVTVPEHETLLSPDMAVLWNGAAPDGVPAQALVMLHPTLDADDRNQFAVGRMGGEPASAAGAPAARNQCRRRRARRPQHAAAHLRAARRNGGLAVLAAGGAGPGRRPPDAGGPQALPRAQRLLHRRRRRRGCARCWRPRARRRTPSRKSCPARCSPRSTSCCAACIARRRSGSRRSPSAMRIISTRAC